MLKEITTVDGNKYERVSRWLRIHHKYVTKRHSLSDYADFSDSEDGYGLVDYFTFNGKKYAIGQFNSLSYPEFFENEDEKTSYLCAYDNTEWYKPLMMEMDDYCKYVRLFVQKGE